MGLVATNARSLLTEPISSAGDAGSFRAGLPYSICAAAKLLNKEITERKYDLKDVKIAKSYNCDKCGMICKRRMCSKACA